MSSHRYVGAMPDAHWKAILHLMEQVGGEKLPSESWWLITEQTAKKLNGGKLPSPGYEALVAIEDVHFWLTRTRHLCRVRWSLRWGRGWRTEGLRYRLSNGTLEAENRALDLVAERLCSSSSSSAIG